MADRIIVTRAKVYPSVAHPGPAWTWYYTVHRPDGKPSHAGTGIAWARRMVKRIGIETGAPIEWTW